MVTELINYNFDQYTDGNGIGGCGYSICDESFDIKVYKVMLDVDQVTIGYFDLFARITST